MYSSYEPISYARHAGMRWSLAKKFEFARELRLIPVTFQEIRRIANSYPLCLRQTGDIIDLVAILANGQGRNIHVDDAGNWTTEYLPLMLRVHPFSLVRRSVDSEISLAVAFEGGLFGTDGEHPLFSEQDKLSPATSIVFAALQAAETQRAQLLAACECVASLGITTPVPPMALNGGLHRQQLFIIDPEKLEALSGGKPETYAELYRQRPFALHLAEAITYSQNSFAFRPLSHEMTQGEHLKQVHPSAAEQQPPPATPDTIDEASFIDYSTTIDFGS